MFGRTAVSSQMIPLAASAALRSNLLPLLLASRAVKCIGYPQENLSFQCPLDGTEVSLQASSSIVSLRMAAAHKTSSNEPCGRLALSVDGPSDAQTTVVGIRQGIVFIRSDSRARMAVDVQQDDVFAIISSLTPPQVDCAIESLLCSLANYADVEDAAEEMLLGASAQRGLAMLVSLGGTPHDGPQPPERFP